VWEGRGEKAATDKVTKEEERKGGSGAAGRSTGTLSWGYLFRGPLSF